MFTADLFKIEEAYNKQLKNESYGDVVNTGYSTMANGSPFVIKPYKPGTNELKDGDEIKGEEARNVTAAAIAADASKGFPVTRKLIKAGKWAASHPRTVIGGAVAGDYLTGSHGLKYVTKKAGDFVKEKTKEAVKELLPTWLGGEKKKEKNESADDNEISMRVYYITDADGEPMDYLKGLDNGYYASAELADSAMRKWMKENNAYDDGDFYFSIRSVRDTVNPRDVIGYNADESVADDADEFIPQTAQQPKVAAQSQQQSKSQQISPVQTAQQKVPQQQQTQSRTWSNQSSGSGNKIYAPQDSRVEQMKRQNAQRTGWGKEAAKMIKPSTVSGNANEFM